MFNPNPQQSTNSIFGSATPFGSANAQSSSNPFGTGSSTPFASTPFGTASNQPQPPFGSNQPSAFGAPATPSSGFRSASFASQPAPQSFSSGATFGFGAPPSSTPLFGPSAPSAQGNSVFGTPSSGAGSSTMFSSSTMQPQGGNSFFSGGSFGSTTPSQSAFGAAPTQSGFGSNATGGSSLFSSARPSGVGGIFGSNAAGTTSPFASAAGSVGSMQQSGTGNPSFSQTSDIESDKTVYLQAVSAMPAYKSKCFEELRWEDYQKGTKFPGFPSSATPNAPMGNFNAPFSTPAPSANTTGTGWFTPSSTPSATGGFGSSTVFGQQQPPATTSFQQPGNSIFPSTNSGSLFQPQQQTSLFGAPKPATTGFGSFQPSTPATPSIGSNFLSGTGGIGMQQQQQQPQQSQPSPSPFSGGSFFNPSATASATPATAPLQQTPAFQTPASGGFSGFGSFNNAGGASALSKPSTGGSGLFNFTPSATTTATSTSTPFNPLGTSNFSMTTPSSKPKEPATIDSNPYGSNALFSSIPQVATPSQPSTQQQIIQPVGVATPSAKKSWFPKSFIKFKPQNFFASGTKSTTPQPSFNSTSIFSDLLAEGKKTGDVKKLVIEFENSQSTASKACSFPVEEESSPQKDSTPKTESQSTLHNPVAYGTREFVAFDSEQSASQGHYFSNPPISQLAKLESTARKSISNFRVGRKGVGVVEFLVPVDLSSIPLERVFGGIVQFTYKQISIYPEDSSIPKAEVGTGLNVPAKVTLYGCWPVDPESKAPISHSIPDETLKLHLRKLALAEDCDFLDFDPQSGGWSFKVNHFSSYSFPEEEEICKKKFCQKAANESLCLELMQRNSRAALADSGLFSSHSTRSCFLGNGKLLVSCASGASKQLVEVSLPVPPHSLEAFDYFVNGTTPKQEPIWKLNSILSDATPDFRKKLIEFLGEYIRQTQLQTNSNSTDIATNLLLGDVPSAIQRLHSESKFRLAAVLQQVPLTESNKQLLAMQIPLYASQNANEETKILRIICGLWSEDNNWPKEKSVYCALQRFLYNLKFSTLSIKDAWKQAKNGPSNDKISCLLDLVLLEDQNILSVFSAAELSILKPSLTVPLYSCFESLLEHFDITSMPIPAGINTSRMSNLMLRKGHCGSEGIDSCELLAFYFHQKDWFSAFKQLISSPESANEAYQLYLHRIMPSNLMLHLTAETESSCDLLGAAILATKFASPLSSSKYLKLAVSFESLFHSIGSEGYEGCSLVEMLEFLDSFYGQTSNDSAAASLVRFAPTPGEMIVWNEILERLCIKAKDSLEQLIHAGNWKSQQIIQAFYLMALNQQQ